MEKSVEIYVLDKGPASRYALSMLERVRKEPCKKLVTVDGHGNPNGFLVELYKDGPKTTLYLSAVYPKAFKGYHLHTVREGHYVCVKGTMKIAAVENGRKVEYILRAENPERLLLPTNVWIGLENIGDEEAWLINFPNPSYDPALAGEQQEKTRLDIERPLAAAGARS